MGDILITLILSNYNDADVLYHQLDSISAQSIFPSEVILVDDGSSDYSAELMRSFATKNKDKNIKLLFCNINRGFEPCVNDAISISTGDYLYFCASDDKLREDFIKDFDKCAKDGMAVISDLENHPSGTFGANDLDKSIINFTHGSAYFPGHASAIRRDIIDEFGRHQNKFLWHADHFLFHAAGFKYGFTSTGKPAAYKTSNENSYCNKGVKTDKQLEVLKSMVEELDKPIYNQFVKDSMLLMIKKLPRGGEIV